MIEGRWLDLDNELDSDSISGGQPLEIAAE